MTYLILNRATGVKLFEGERDELLGIWSMISDRSWKLMLNACGADLYKKVE